MKRAELYHGDVQRISLDGESLKYTVMNSWHIETVFINDKQKTLYQSGNGYYVNLNGKRKYLEIE